MSLFLSLSSHRVKLFVCFLLISIYNMVGRTQVTLYSNWSKPMVASQVLVERPHNPLSRWFKVVPDILPDAPAGRCIDVVAFSALYSTYAWENRLNTLDPCIRAIVEPIFRDIEGLRQIYISKDKILCVMRCSDDETKGWNEEFEALVQSHLLSLL